MSSPSMFVVMTHHDHSEYTQLALRSLEQNTETPYFVEVVDDGSEKPFWMLDRLENQGIMRFGSAIGWNAVANWAIKRFSMRCEDYFVLVNNDVVFCPGWEKGLMRCFDYSRCGIAGPLTNQPGHQPEQMAQLAHGQDPDKLADFFKEAAVAEDRGVAESYVEYVNGFCFMLLRERIPRLKKGTVFFEGEEVVGGGQHPHYGGEMSLQARLGEAGFGAMVAPASRVYHFKDVTMETAKEGRLGMREGSLPRLDMVKA